MPIYKFSTLPPSTNALYRNVTGRGRVITGAYHRWVKGAMSELMAQRREPIKGPYKIGITLPQTQRHPLSDLGNREKALQDLLVKCELIEDDRFCERLIMQWGEIPYVDVVVEIA